MMSVSLEGYPNTRHPRSLWCGDLITQTDDLGTRFQPCFFIDDVLRYDDMKMMTKILIDI